MHRIIRNSFVYIALSTLSTTSFSAVASIEEQRKQFIQAELLLKQNKITAYSKIRPHLDDYPLAPYLDYQKVLKNLNTAKPDQISEFIVTHNELPIANRLNRTWLNHLNKQKKWNIYSHHFSQHPVNHIHYECKQQEALLNGSVKEKKEALSKAKELWLVGYSQPTACDPLFKAWMATGHPTSAEANQRFWLSIEQENVKFARYLDKKITNKQHKELTKLFWSIYDEPHTVSIARLSTLPKGKQIAAAKLIYKKWYRSQSVTAAKSWINARDDLMSSEEQLSVTEYMGLRLNRNYYSQAIKLSALLDPEYKIESLTEVRIRNALAYQDWEAVRQGVTHLTEEEALDPKWQYWKLIAERHLAPNKEHKAELQTLSKDRSFYGFLAAELNESSFQLNEKSDAATPEQLDALSKQPAVARAKEFFILGRLIEANREWNSALSKMTDEEFATAGYLAKSWDWHLQAIINAAKTKRWDHIDLRFPHPHAQLFKKYALQNELDLSFPVAIARQESAFLYNAQSRVGARGLMQLMPQTAKQTASKHKVPYKKTSELYNPETNITLGSAYLGDMLKRFDNNPAFAAAAYNAGPHRVKKWLKQRGNLPLDIWIETIPFSETRKYVQNVLAFRVIYDQLEGRKPSLLTEKQVTLLAVNQSKKAAL